MKIYPYKNYADYVAAQTAGNHAKITTVWVTAHNIDLVCAHRGPDVQKILCHGTRNAAEQFLFKARYPDAAVLGTEISDTAATFPMTTRWDMQMVNAGWLGFFDIVFSNAIDHAIYPEQTIRVWLDQLAPEGVLYIDHANDRRVNRFDRTDPFEIGDAELAAMIEGCGGKIEKKMGGFGPRKCPTRIYAVRRA